MILTTHAITGATLASLMPNHPVLGFVAGFTSHFLLDAIPHWDYPISSMKTDQDNPLNNSMVVNKYFYIDLIKFGIDGLLGLFLSFVLFGVIHQSSPFIIFIGAIGGMAPDVLQFFYWKWKCKLLESLQKFHLSIHSKIELNNQPIFGILLQIVFIYLIVFVLR